MQFGQDEDTPLPGLDDSVLGNMVLVSHPQKIESVLLDGVNPDQPCWVEIFRLFSQRHGCIVVNWPARGVPWAVSMSPPPNGPMVIKELLARHAGTALGKQLPANACFGLIRIDSGGADTLYAGPLVNMTLKYCCPAPML